VDKNPNRKLITCAVPAIVSAETWEAAQQVLRSNRIVCKRTTKQPYLLRGLIKCGLCGLTFCGMRSKPPQQDHYYRCNGHQFARGLYGTLGKKCHSKSLNGEYVEGIVWADIEAFLRDPGDVLERLRQRFTMRDDERQRRQKELDGFKIRLEEKTAERSACWASSAAAGSTTTRWTSTWI
jgi:site-specific DNA recombinase